MSATSLYPGKGAGTVDVMMATVPGICEAQGRVVSEHVALFGLTVPDRVGTFRIGVDVPSEFVGLAFVTNGAFQGSAQATSGAIVVTRAVPYGVGHDSENAGVAGTFDAVLDDGSTISGTFDAPPCNRCRAR